MLFMRLISFFLSWVANTQLNLWTKQPTNHVRPKRLFNYFTTNLPIPTKKMLINSSQYNILFKNDYILALFPLMAQFNGACTSFAYSVKFPCASI